MTVPMFITDAYCRTALAQVHAVTEIGIILDQTIFYATSGGQPGDQGTLAWDGGTLAIEVAIKRDAGDIVLVPEMGQSCRPLAPLFSNRLIGIIAMHICGCTRHCICYQLLYLCPSQVDQFRPLKGGWILICPRHQKIKRR